MKTKQELKQVFSGLSSIMLQKDGIADLATLTPDFDLPVTVDSLNFTVGEPTINRTKVHGLQADWAITSTAGEVTFAATVPSINEELVAYFMGEPTKVEGASLGENTWNGFATSLTTKKVIAGVILMNEEEDKLVVIKRLALYARPLFENASTTPFAFALSGSMEVSDEANNGDIAFLEKQVNA